MVESPEGTSTVAIPVGDAHIVTVGEQTFTVSGGDVVLGEGTTLNAATPTAVVAGTTFSLGPSGIVASSPEGTSTVPIPVGNSEVVTIGGEVYTVVGGELVLGPGTTIGAGDAAITSNGTTFSVGSTGIVVQSEGGTTTVPITETETGTGDSAEFTGGASRSVNDGTQWAVLLVVGYLIAV